MDKQQIIAALVPLYRLEAAANSQLEMLAKEAAQEGDTTAFEAISRRAVNKSCFLDGMKAAVEALGISEDEFMDAVNQDRAAQAEKDRKEEDKCQEH